MKKRWLPFVVICCIIFIVGCNSEDKQAEDKQIEDDQTEEKEMDDQVDEKETEDKEEIEENEGDTQDAEQDISGKLIINEEENKLEIQAESNLVPETEVEIKVYERPFISLRTSIPNGEDVIATVQEDGSFEADYEVDSDFFHTYNGQYVEVDLEVKPDKTGNKITEAYGETGELFAGPFVYENELFDMEYQLYAPVYLLIGEDETKYVIEAPNRDDVPDDYGDTDIWLEAEVVDNDHRYMYVEGKSNIVEGTNIFGRYFSDEEEHFAQETHGNKMYVEPDGTFFLPVAYDTITDAGFIELRSAPLNRHRTPNKIHEMYGDDYEKLSGDIVKQVDDHQEILLTIDAESIGIEPPKDSFITEEDGELKIQMPDEVLFDFDKSDLKSDAKNTLEDVIAILEGLEDDTKIEINGHTDNQGEADYNLGLSEDRAQEVEDYVTKNGKIDHLEIDRHGYGETKPIESNESEEGREKNRRVEIVIENMDE